MTSRAAAVRKDIPPDEVAEELQLWADYYEATERALGMVRAGTVTAENLPKIIAEDAKAAAAIKRIKQIRGIRD
jgi:hypothetical protein